ncbi:YjiH family protein [Cetobacterium sp.]|uniref:YjiH family protein n=1 Tax=Cetobacterium sp. TaxID=2071632 RepID=UPI003F2DACE6
MVINTFKFGFYSFVGIWLFLVPMVIGGESGMLLGHIKSHIVERYDDIVKIVTAGFAVVTIFGTILGMKRKTFNDKVLDGFFVSSKFVAGIRILGALILILITYNFLPESLSRVVADEATGLMMIDELLPTILVTFFLEVMLIPLLTSFGLVEFIGTLIAPYMRKLFKVPGYAAIDALASFVGDGTIGIVVTDQQYEKGYYTQKEAAIIATSFSLVGISFAIMMADLLRLSHIFGYFYGTIIVCTILTGVVISRMPLKKFKDRYYKEGKAPNESDTSMNYAIRLASDVAGKTKATKVLKDSFIKVLTIYVTFTPVIMLVGTIGLVLADKTNFFQIVTAPMVPFLEFIGFEREIAQYMAPSMIIGITDMWLPAVFIKDCPSELARFVIGGLTFSQLIYFSETGIILMNSKIGFNFFDVMKIFFLRSIVAFPMIYAAGLFLLKIGLLAN